MKANVLVLSLTVGTLISFDLPAGAQATQAPAQPAQNTTTTAGADARKGPDGVLKAQGSIHYRKDGQLTRVTHELKLSEGIVARPDGQITLKDGKNITLQEGQLLTLDGKIQEAGIATGATGTSAITLPQKPELQDKGNEGPDLQKKAAEKQQ